MALANSAKAMKSHNWIKGLAISMALAYLSPAAAADPVRVFAAASLQGPLDEIAAEYDPDSTISYGGSGTIARQISLGAPADAVLLANGDWAKWLVEQGHAPGPAQPVLSNRLVLIAPPDTARPGYVDTAVLLGYLDGGRLAMGQQMSVPAGIYARAWLTSIGAWEALRPRLAETENVRAALALVARGEAPLGIVYTSDAQASDAVRVIWEVPAAQHPPILYYGLALTPSGRDFLDLLTTRIAAFEKAGFVALP